MKIILVCLLAVALADDPLRKVLKSPDRSICRDVFVNCAESKRYCKTIDMIKKLCAKTCNTCEGDDVGDDPNTDSVCSDVSHNCARSVRYCKTIYMIKNCARTCGYC